MEKLISESKIDLSRIPPPHKRGMPHVKSTKKEGISMNKKTTTTKHYNGNNELLETTTVLEEIEESIPSSQHITFNLSCNGSSCEDIKKIFDDCIKKLKGTNLRQC